MEKISENLWIKYWQHVTVSDIAAVLYKVCNRWAVSIFLSTAVCYPSLRVALLKDNFMARNSTKPWWHFSVSMCPSWTTAASVTDSQGWITSCAEFNELPNASKCQKVQGKMHSTEHGTDRNQFFSLQHLPVNFPWRFLPFTSSSVFQTVKWSVFP